MKIINVKTLEAVHTLHTLHLVNKLKYKYKEQIAINLK